ncbi:MAG: DUF2059 domain-containing protein [Alphaproteobacteria bacterium]|nr:DUF2059 domain-containing protein [Alphaproteobacteria bacterium]
MRAGVLCFLSAAGLAALIALSPGRANAEIDEKTLDAAHQFVTAMRVEATLEQLMPNIVAVMVALVTKANPGEGKVAGEIIDKHFIPIFRERMSDHLDGIARIYAFNYSADELRELTLMFSTPLGRKFADKQGEIGKQSMVFGARWGQELSRELLRRIEPELRERGLKAPI